MHRFSFGGQYKKYKGEFQRGQFFGNGILVSTNGDRYIGTFKNGQKHGYGRIVNQEDKELKQGEWNEGDFLKALKKSDDLKKLDKLVSKI